MLVSVLLTDFLPFGPGPISLFLEPLNLLIRSRFCSFLLEMGAPIIKEGSASRKPEPVTSP